MITSILGKPVVPAGAKTVAIIVEEDGKEKRGILYVAEKEIKWDPQPFEFVRCSHGPVTLNAEDLKEYTSAKSEPAETKTPKVEKGKKKSKKK